MRIFDFDRAIVREPAESVVHGLRTGSQAPAHGRVLAEHRLYVAALEAAGVAVEMLPPLPDHPDSVFVEDPAFVIPEGAILLRPGAPSRFAEPATLAPALHRHFSHVAEVAEGFVDGGDILILPDEILVGLSERTDRAGARRFCGLARDLGRSARIVEPPLGLLHLKTGCALVDEGILIAVPAIAPLFPGLELLLTPPGEEHSANLIRINDRILMGAGFPQTAALLAGRGLEVVETPAAEIAKIDAGLSCMSLRWHSGGE
ncbi:MAG: dimethylargininase [Sphingomonadales bacterium]|nr:dimethylargininase [Sphingomonadales bacterium]